MTLREYSYHPSTLALSRAKVRSGSVPCLTRLRASDGQQHEATLYIKFFGFDVPGSEPIGSWGAAPHHHFGVVFTTGEERQPNLGNVSVSDHWGPNEAELEDKHHHDSGQRQNRAVQQLFTELLLFIRNLTLLFGFVEITENFFSRFPHSRGLAPPRAPVTSCAQCATRFSPYSAC